MRLRKAFLIIGLGTILSATAATAATLGPPLALMGQDQWGVGLEYGRQSVDLQADGTVDVTYLGVRSVVAESLCIEDLNVNMVFGTLAYGVWDDWDVFVRLGASDAEADVNIRGYDVSGELGDAQQYAIDSFDSSYGFAWGVGTRATFHRWGPWAIGGLAQFTWFQPDEGDVSYTDPLLEAGASHAGEMSLDYWTVQLSLAAVYQVDAWQFWAGPFVQFIRGDLDRNGEVVVNDEDDPIAGSFDGSADLEEESQIGAHVGATWDVADEWNVWAEGQFTGDSWLIGLGLIFLPGRSSL